MCNRFLVLHKISRISTDIYKCRNIPHQTTLYEDFFHFLSRGVSVWHRSATVTWDAQVNRCTCHTMLARNSDHLSAALQPRAHSMPASASNGLGQRGKDSPLPSANCRFSGRRNRQVSGSTPTVRIRRSDSMYRPDQDVLAVVQRCGCAINIFVSFSFSENFSIL